MSTTILREQIMAALVTRLQTVADLGATGAVQRPRLSGNGPRKDPGTDQLPTVWVLVSADDSDATRSQAATFTTWTMPVQIDIHLAAAEPNRETPDAVDDAEVETLGNDWEGRIVSVLCPFTLDSAGLPKNTLGGLALNVEIIGAARVESGDADIVATLELSIMFRHPVGNPYVAA